MFCKNCGEKLNENQKFCTSCGTKFLNVDKEEKKVPETQPFKSIIKNKSPWGVGRIIAILVVLAMIVIGVYNSLDEDTIAKNNEGLSSFNSGDNQVAINQFQQASQAAVSNENKTKTLKNLAYVYVTEGQNEQALSTFKEALNLTKVNSFDYYLISGEIALLEYKPNSAILSFNKAYELNPTDFQLNNTLALFYMDLEEIAPQYVDYPKALAYAKKAYEYDSEKSEVSKQNLAIAYYFNDNFDQAISLMSTTNLDQHPYVAIWLGMSYLAKEDEINARINFQKAIKGGAEIPQEITDYLNSN
ncbi:MAG: zinc-ribbon domain-containing protein [Planctomycetes bacterium]|jgi:tetratricopeptide (TPR) repeat protein|nr:zinc-ribbon domain-containing protein [Planctomycetota bacterium]